MVISLVQNLNASCADKLLKAVNNLWNSIFKLLKRNSAHTISRFKPSISSVDKLKYYLISGDVAFAAYFSYYGLIFSVIKVFIMLSNLKNRVMPKPKRLMKLEIKAYAYHFNLQN